MTGKKGYPRKVLVMSTTGLVEQTVNDLLPDPAPVLAIFQAGGWTTCAMRMQAFQALDPYMLLHESPWIFGYHRGIYQAKKLSWEYAGYASASWSDLLTQMVSCYYTYEERKPAQAYELEILGKHTLDIRRKEDIALAKRIALPGSNHNFVVDELNRAYIAYADRAVAQRRKQQLEQTGRFRVRMSSCPLPEWMKS